MCVPIHQEQSLGMGRGLRVPFPTCRSPHFCCFLILDGKLPVSKAATMQAIASCGHVPGCACSPYSHAQLWPLQSECPPAAGSPPDGLGAPGTFSCSVSCCPVNLDLCFPHSYLSLSDLQTGKQHFHLCLGFQTACPANPERGYLDGTPVGHSRAASSPRRKARSAFSGCFLCPFWSTRP